MLLKLIRNNTNSAKPHRRTNVQIFPLENVVQIQKYALETIKFITARKRSLGLGNIFTGICLSAGRCGRHSLLGRPPQKRWPLKRAVRILLECILVFVCYFLDTLKGETFWIMKSCTGVIFPQPTCKISKFS